MTMTVVSAPTSLPRSNEPCWCGSGRKFKRCHKGEAVASVVKGVVSPMRPVPASIPRPDYAESGTPRRRPESLVKTPEQLERMRRAGQAAAEVLAETAAAIRPGTTTDELDVIAHEACLAHGGYPSPLNYNHFPKSLCTSVNEVICHGIPDSRALVEGDIVNLDVTIFLDGVHGDTDATYPVGEIDDESARLIEVTRECLELGIAAVRPGRPVRDIGRAIEGRATSEGYGVVRVFVGHGIGEQFHTSWHMPHYDDPAATTILKPGMTFTIEPMITLGDIRHEVWDDDWTAVTRDRRRTAQFEHTVAVTDDGVEVLTRQQA